MLRGTVKFFDARPGKKFGFIIREDGRDEIFFHYNDGQLMEMWVEEPRFTGTSTVVRRGQTSRLREPQKDDVLVFQVDSGRSERIKASPWCFASVYDKLLAKMAALPVYRLVSQQGFWLGGKKPSGDPHVEFEGTIPAFLKWASDRQGRIITHKVSTLPFSHDDGFYTDRWFEVKTEDSWQKVDNPFYEMEEQGKIVFSC
jgi:'Cold-shock' DNA-binding domain